MDWHVTTRQLIHSPRSTQLFIPHHHHHQKRRRFHDITPLITVISSVPGRPQPRVLMFEVILNGVGKSSTGLWLGLRWGVFTCVRWQITNITTTTTTTHTATAADTTVVLPYCFWFGLTRWIRLFRVMAYPQIFRVVAEWFTIFFYKKGVWFHMASDIW